MDGPVAARRDDPRAVGRFAGESSAQRVGDRVRPGRGDGDDLQALRAQMPRDGREAALTSRPASLGVGDEKSSHVRVVHSTNPGGKPAMKVSARGRGAAGLTAGIAN